MYRIILFLLLFGGSLMAQDEIVFDKEKKEKTILIVPFSPKLYFNDAGMDMHKQSGKSYDEILNLIRLYVDEKLMEVLADSSDVASLMSNTTFDDGFNVEKMYTYMNYFHEDAPNVEYEYVINPPKSKLAHEEPRKAKIDKNKPEEVPHGQIGGPIVNYGNKFVNVKLTNKEYVTEMLRHYKAKYLLTINQFEIRGNYHDPYKVGAESFKYIIKIHFSIFDDKADFVYGSFCATDYPAGIKSIDHISAKYFPVVARKILLSFPVEQEKQKRVLSTFKR